MYGLSVWLVRRSGIHCRTACGIRLLAGTVSDNLWKRFCSHIRGFTTMRYMTFYLLTYLLIAQLHWLPVQQRVVFKIATLVHRSLSGNAPGYLADDCPLVADARVRQLRSADTRTLVSQTRSSFGDRTFAAAAPKVLNSLPPNLTYGRRAFAVAGPTMFNTLPDDLRDPAVSTTTFGQSLKTHLFSAYQHV